MRCSLCGKPEIILTVKVAVDNNETTIGLCKDCAEKLGIDISNFGNIDEILNSLFFREESSFDVYDDFLKPFKKIVNAKTNDVVDTSQSNNPINKKDIKKCPSCNSTLEEILESSRIRCVKCLQVFAKDLKIDTYRYNGRVPKAYRYIYIEEKFRKYLLNKLNVALTKENFEEAAKIKKIIDKVK